MDLITPLSQYIWQRIESLDRLPHKKPVEIEAIQ
jgi:hypothetical protein